MSRIARARTDGYGPTPSVRKHVAASDTYGFDFGPLLGDGVTLTGTPVVDPVPSGLTLSDIQITSSTFEDEDGETVAIGKGITIRVADGDVDVSSYRFTISCDTSVSSTLAETFVVSIYEDC